MTKAVFFDLGKVLVDFDYDLPMKHLAVRTQFSEDRFEKVLRPLRAAFNVGKLDPQTFYEEVCRLTGLDMSFENFRAIWQGVIIPVPDKSAVLKRLKVPALILSNTDAFHWEAACRLPMPQCIDAAVLSFEEGCEKPDPRIYRAALARFKLAPEEVLYLDDRPELVAAFRKLGGQAEVYNTDFAMTDSLESVLSKYGCLA